MLDRLAIEHFEPLLGQEIAVEHDGQSLTMELKSVRPLKNPSPRATPPFALMLRSRDRWRGPQGLYRLRHPTLGVLELFVVPVGPDAEGLCYEIVLN